MKNVENEAKAKSIYTYGNNYCALLSIDYIPQPDIVITMGCNVNCPYLPCKYREDWGLEDPTGKSYEEFINTAKTIEKRVLELKDRILNYTIT